TELAAPQASRRVERPARHRRVRASQREERRQLQRHHLEGRAEPVAEPPEGERRPGGSAEGRRARRRARRRTEGRDRDVERDGGPARRYKSFCESTLHTA